MSVSRSGGLEILCRIWPHLAAETEAATSERRSRTTSGPTSCSAVASEISSHLNDFYPLMFTEKVTDGVNECIIKYFCVAIETWWNNLAVLRGGDLH